MKASSDGSPPRRRAHGQARPVPHETSKVRTLVRSAPWRRGGSWAEDPSEIILTKEESEPCHLRRNS
ncbi:MAG: hypothetical protein MUC92_07495, partial [Fimbriimonadaceae bacterium]|nr:hypothetical protein [Fimbriimonadaceae bacterium]